MKRDLGSPGKYPLLSNDIFFELVSSSTIEYHKFSKISILRKGIVSGQFRKLIECPGYGVFIKSDNSLNRERDLPLRYFSIAYNVALNDTESGPDSNKDTIFQELSLLIIVRNGVRIPPGATIINHKVRLLATDRPRGPHAADT